MDPYLLHAVNVDQVGRFTDEFGSGRSNNHEDEDGISKSWKTSKPSYFQALFGGNNNDHFMIGIEFTRKTIKLYSDFYTSGMIIVSPPGLITVQKQSDVSRSQVWFFRGKRNIMLYTRKPISITDTRFVESRI